MPHKIWRGLRARRDGVLDWLRAAAVWRPYTSTIVLAKEHGPDLGLARHTRFDYLVNLTVTREGLVMSDGSAGVLVDAPWRSGRLDVSGGEVMLVVRRGPASGSVEGFSVLSLRQFVPSNLGLAARLRASI